MNVVMGEHSTFDSHDFRCGRVYYSELTVIANFV
jgi:hypothetical protein